MKKFKRKKNLWEQIAADIEKVFQCKRSPIQCENRYKTVLKRKKKAVDNNHTSGCERQDVPYEEQLTKIAAVDDSIEPEVGTRCQPIFNIVF